MSASDPQPEPGSRPRIFHLHIRKTSGTVLYQAIRRAYGQAALFPYRSDLEFFGRIVSKEARSELVNKSPAISGHLYQTAALADASFPFVTILRNPVARAVSAFNHMKADERDPYHRAIKDLSWKEAINAQQFAQELWNGQTRALVQAAGREFEGLTDVERIDVALNFLKRMRVFGFQENLRHFYDNIRREFGFDVDFRARVNSKITENGLRVSEVYDSSRDVVGRNRLDVIVYFEAITMSYDD